MSAVSIEADTDAVVQDLTEMSARIEDPSPAYKAIAPLMRERNVSHDQEELGVDGPYAPLSPSYEEQKNKRWPGKRILERTGELQAGFYDDADSMMAEAGNLSEVALFHMGDGARSVMPLRDPVFWDTDVIDDAEEILSGFILEGRL